MKRTDDFRNARRICAVKIGILIMLFCCTFYGLYLLSQRHFSRYFCGMAPWPNAKWVAELPEPLAIEVRFYGEDQWETSSSEIWQYLQFYLKNLQETAKKAEKTLAINWVNLSREEKESFREPGILLTSNSGQYLIEWNDLLQMQDGKLEGLRIPSALEKGVEQLSQRELLRAYFIEGQEEASLEDRKSARGLSRLKSFLKEKNIPTYRISTGELSEIDATNSVVFVVDPHQPFEPAQEAELQSFLEDNSGRLCLVFSGNSPSTLNTLLLYRGISLGENLLEPAGNDLLEDGILAHRFASEHSLLQPLIHSQLGVKFSSARPLRFVASAELSPMVTNSPLIEVLVRPDSAENNTAIQPNHEILAMASESRTLEHLPIHLPSGRLLVFGGNFLSNQQLHFLGNQMLLDSALNWLLDQHIDGEIPADISIYKIPLSKKDLHQLAFSLLGGSSLVLLWLLLVVASRPRK